MIITITIEGVTRHLNVDEEDIYNHDFNATIADMYDSIEKAKLE